MRTVCVTLALFVSAAAGDPDPTKGDRPFDGITPEQIKKRLDAARGPARDIDGSDGPTNQIPPNTVVLYRTGDGHHGKLKVIHYGYNLTVKWVTYKPDGSVLSKGDNLVVRGTWSYDLDHGTEGDKRKSRTDFWWQQATRVKRSLTPQNGARFVVFDDK